MRRLGCAAALVTLAGCSEALDEDAGLSHAQYSERLEAVGVDQTLLGHEWLDAAHAALTEPMPVTLPYAESGGFVGHEATALGLAFSAVAGQKLRLEVTQPEPQNEGTPVGRIYADVFRIEELRNQVRYIWLGVLPLGESQLQIELPRDATYVVRVQPELLTDARYRVALELDAVLPFPVSGFHSDAVRSFFGAERDAGARHHEGVDIFAPRSTPVLAVSDGRATARVNELGGNTVWLSTAGTSYYYAHLETQAITGTRWVRTGDVLGYVGNTGNAVTAPPHLHFGVYRWGRGAIDPLPLLGAHRFANELGVADFEPRYVKTRGSQLNLRRGPSPRSPVIEQLPAATIVRATAASGDWLRVRLPQRESESGWIHRRYQTALTAAVGVWRASEPTFVLDSIGGAIAVDGVGVGAELDILGEADRYLLLRNPRNGRHGWIAPNEGG